MRPLVIVGAGGFGRETVDTVRAINEVRPTWRLLGISDDGPSHDNLTRLEALGLPHVGATADIPLSADVAIAVGNPSTRRQLATVLRERGHAFPSLIHPSTVIGNAFAHGEGLITLAGVSIGTNIDLGGHVHLNAHVVLGHDTRLNDFVSVNPNATISGECAIGSGTLIGAASTVLQNLFIGQGVTVGAAACVIADIPDRAIVKGVPAR